MRCAVCETENPEGFKFCGNCGAPLVEAVRPQEVRKTVTVVFCDLTGSTDLGDRTDPEALRSTMRRYYEEMRTILERHGGTVEKFIGDAVMAVFGVPVAHEDDALRAVRAAWEMRAAVPELGLAARIGVNTGEVVAGEGDTLVTGDAVNVAARLEQAAEPGQVLIGDETRRLVRDAVRVESIEVDAKGKPLPVQAHRLIELDVSAAAVARRLDTPLVGRRAELEQLERAFERAVRERRCYLFTLLGTAGIGKSRLVNELLGSLDATIVEGRCLDYGEGITFWPVISMLKQLGARADSTLAHVVDGAESANELFYAIRTLLEDVAAERPLVVLFDDVHWGEETFLDLIDHVADMSRGAPILLLCVARPELLDKRPGWAGGKLNATTVLLEPLTAEECADLIAVHGGVDAGMSERILAAADGNPLFVEEMVALAHENGDVRVPATVQALLQARIDQLGADERAVIERGAVEGQLFHRGAVAELARPAEVDPQLVGLVRKELIHPAPATLTGDQAFRFRHLLIRDAAYDSLPKETRAELHERFADWLLAHGQALIELDEVVGYHLEQAARYRGELDRPDVEIAARAAERLAAAGTRAVARCDAPAAINLYERAWRLLPPGHSQRTPVAVALLLVVQETLERSDLLDELAASGDEALQMHVRLARVFERVTAATMGEQDHEAFAEAKGYFEHTGDVAGLAHAALVESWFWWIRSRGRETLEALDRFHAWATEAGLAILGGSTSMMSIGPLTHGPFTVAEIDARLEPLRRSDSLVAEHHLNYVASYLALIEGRFDDAERAAARAFAIAGTLGLPIAAVAGGIDGAERLQQSGRFEEARNAFAEVDRVLSELGLESFRSTVVIRRGEVAYALGDLDEAERFAIEGEALGAAEDVVNFAVGRAVRACVAADRGDLAAAETLAREAFGYAYETDFPIVQGDAHEALAHVLRAAGRSDEARAELEQALELWTRYGYLVKAERTRALLGEL